ncbi:MAG: multicopper oxidase type 3, partial [Gammaproteobacteria bacterium]|nr:multicopper oxidase type 3 [Gammaproteobacteria bacterium]
MRYESVKTLVRSAAIALPALLGTGYASAQTTVALTAQPATATMPDGNSVPMWSFCQSAAVGTPGSSTGTCPTAGGPWTPGPTIVVPTDSTGFGSLTITLTNNLKASTSIVILGQLGGGLGTGGALPTDVPRMDLPAPHSGQPAITWPAVNTAATFVPPAQGSRARAFGPETSAGGSATYSWAKLRPGTYLYESGSVPSLQVPMGLYGVIIVTQPPTDTAAGVAYPTAASAAGTPTATNVPYDADVALLFSEIDPRQNAAVDAAATDGISELVLFNDPSCTLAGTAGTHHCYPPAVNYAPTYFMINGQAYDPSAPAMSGFALPGNTILKNGGQVLLRLLNAGSRTHVPTVIGVPSLSIVAEDGNLAPGVPKAQSHILMPASKTFDAVMAPPQTTPATSPASYAIASYPIFDRALSLTSGNLDKQTVVPNSGMLGFIAVQPANSIIGSATGAAVPTALLATANNDAFATAINTAFNGNVIANDLNVVNAALSSNVSNGTLVLNADGSFIYTPASDFFGTDNFTYTGNPNSATPTAPAMVTITVGVDPTKGAPTAANATFTSKVASVFKSGAPGVLANDTDPAKLGLTAWLDDVGTCSSVDLKTDGSFTAVPSTAGLSCTFHYHAKNSLGGVSASKDATVNFTPGTGLVVRVQDTQDPTITVPDYSWVIEEDTTYFHDPANPSAVNTLATNFHKSFMPVLASGCTGSASCGDVQTVGGIPAPARARSLPSDVVLDPTKRYFISILPGDADQGSAAYNADGTFSVTSFGHSVGGVSIPAAIPAVGAANPAAQVAATVLVPRNPLPPAQLTVYVFEDNNPTNGGVDDNEPGLGGFTINIFDTRGSSGDPAGQMTYDLSGMPLTNSLANQTDSVTHVNLCPINGPSGTIITCPALDSRGQPSPLAGLANIKNFIPGRFDVWAHPGVERSAKGENWIQVSTLEGTHANDTFIKAGEPPYWQEFGPPGFHSFIGFVNPAHIASVNKAQHGTATVNGRVPSLHMDRPRPAMSNLNDSCATAMKPDNTPVNPQDPSCRATLASTTCYVAVNSSAGTGATVAMATCDAYGNFSLKNVPAGEHELVIWDQWLDQIIAYKALTVLPSASPSIVNAGDIPVFSWFTSVAQSAFIDLNQNGVKDVGEPGVSQVPMNIRFRDGSISNFLTTDNSGSVTASEVFPLFNWYVLESDTTRYTGTGVSVTYDAGGQPDTATTSIVDLNGAAQTKDYRGLLNSAEANPLDASLLPAGSKATPNSTMRIDPGTTLTEGVQSYINQTSVVDWGKRPYVPGETGGIMGLVFYAATRGFDDPSLEVQFSWEPAVARVPVNLYQEVANADGSVSRILVDQTTTWSWDDSTASMHCPGEPAFDITNTNPTGDPFVNVTLAQSVAQATTNDPTVTAAAGATARTKCYDGQHSFNQVQPAVYDGRYRFPTANCTICVANPANTGLPQKPASVVYPKVLPAGKYVVEVVVPSGYEIVKEEDKNILIG